MKILRIILTLVLIISLVWVIYVGSKGGIVSLFDSIKSKFWSVKLW